MAHKAHQVYGVAEHVGAAIVFEFRVKELQYCYKIDAASFLKNEAQAHVIFCRCNKSVEAERELPG